MKVDFAATVAALAATAATGLGPEDLLLENMPDASQPGGVEAATAWAKSLTTIGEGQFKGTRMASPEQWNDLSMYQIFIDRFNNGNAANDMLNMEAFQREEMQRSDFQNPHLYRHGGDLQGITDRLDYLQSLGMDIVFITSFLENREGMFHGYCVSNHVQIDEGFGTLEDLQTLTSEAHKRGMYVVMDFVVNHVCDPSTDYKRDGGFQYPSFGLRDQCVSELFNAVENLRPDDNIGGRGELNFGDTFFPPLKRQEYFSRCGKGLTEDLGGAKYADFVEWMFDLQTAHSQVHLMLTEMAKYWIAAADVDGFRLDATKHVSDSLAPYFAAHVRDYANKLGKDNFYVIGEVVAGWDWQARQTGTMEVGDLTPATRKAIEDTRSLWSAHPTQSFPGFTAVYDFAHGGTVRSIVRREQSPTSLAGVLGDDQRKPLLANSDDNQFWVLVDQHDWARLLAKDDSLKYDQGAIMSAYSYTFMARGIPHIYYGTEHGFNGDCWWFRDDGSDVFDLGSDSARDRIRRHCAGDETVEVERSFDGDKDALYRQTMWVTGGYKLGMADRTRANQLVGITNPRGANPFTWTEDPFLAENAITSLVKRLTAARRSCVALRRGLQFSRRSTDDGLISFARKFYNQEIVVAVNMRGNSVWVGNLFMSPDVASGTYVNLFNAAERGQVRNGQLETNLNLCGHCVAVFVREDYLGADGQCNPDVDPRAALRAPELQDGAGADAGAGAVPVAAVAGGATAAVVAVAAAFVVVRRRRSNASGAMSGNVVSDVATANPKLGVEPQPQV